MKIIADNLLKYYCIATCQGDSCNGNRCEDYLFLEGFIRENEIKECEEKTNTVKDKEGKPQMRLILPHAAEALVRIREYGLKKYPQADNWKSVPKEDWTDAMFRHLMKYIGGEETDEESGMPHLWHALCNLSYLIELDWKENAK